MGRGHEANARTQKMRTVAQALRPYVLDDLPSAGDAAPFGDVGLNHAERAAGDALRKGLAAQHVFPSGHQYH